MYMKKKFLKLEKGVTLVEVLVAAGIIVTFLTTLVSVHNTYLRSSFSNVDSVKATFLAEEGIEAVKGIRDTSWASNILPLTNGTAYYLVFGNGAWSLNTTSTSVDSRFYRKITLSAVNRDSVSAITTSGGTLDANTRKITSSVSWLDRGATTTRSIDTYIANIFSN